MRDQAGTRARIQEVALDLFAEQGYEATSLREIAERLGVTKAALYYHFKTKEDIVASLIDDRIQMLDELYSWAGEQVDSPDMRRELIIRYAQQLNQARHHQIMRFMERNQTALQDHPQVARMRETMFKTLSLLSAPSDPLEVRLKRSLAIFALHASLFVLRDPEITDEQRQKASLEVALDLVS